MGFGSLGEAVLDLRADYQKMLKDIKDARRVTLKKMDSWGQAMQGAGTKMSAALTLPILAVGAASVDAASDLDESLSKTNVVFGEQADAIVAWSEESATALGISQQAALEAIGTYGNLFSAFDVLPDASAEMSKGLVQNAADLASFNNASPEDMLNALRAGITGEAEPLKKYGIALTAAAVDQKALEMGLVDINGEISEAGKIQARYAIIQEQAALAQGDFARTSDGLANSTRIVKAQLTDASAALGKQLLPFVLQGVQLFSELVGKFQALSPETQKTILVVLGLVAALGPLLIIIGSLMSAFSAIGVFMSGPIAAAIWSVLVPIAAVVALLALLALAWKNNWGDIQGKTQAVITFLSAFFKQFIEGMVALWQNVLWPALQKVWAWMDAVLFPFLMALGEFIGAVLGVAVEALAGLWQNVLWPALKNFIAWVDKNVMPILEPIAKFLGGKFALAFEGISTAIQGVTGWLKDMAAMLNNLTLPDWLTPGSPTPFETGLWGINKALGSVGKISLPTLTSSLGDMPMPGLAGGGALAGVGGGGFSGQIVYAPFISTSDEREAKRLLRGVIEDVNREGA